MCSPLKELCYAVICTLLGSFGAVVNTHTVFALKASSELSHQNLSKMHTFLITTQNYIKVGLIVKHQV
jgi:hypothetical protein